jgi:pimeloyl-ACP methyl ester carboxylesterase
MIPDHDDDRLPYHALMATFVLDGPHGRIAGDELGSGPPVLLIAGAGSTRRLWGTFPELLARRFTVLTVDNRGVGGGRTGARFTVDRAVDDLVTVLDRRDRPQVAVLGASMGGLIALSLAIRVPHRVRSLVLASCAPHLSHHGRRTLAMLRDVVEHLPPEAVGRTLMALAFAPPFALRFPAFVDEAASAYGLDPLDRPGAADQLDHLLAGWDLRERLVSLDVPSLALAGGRDPIVSAEDTAELASLMPRCELITVPDAAHSVLAEGGSEVLDRVIEFLSVDS